MWITALNIEVHIHFELWFPVIIWIKTWLFSKAAVRYFPKFPQLRHPVADHRGQWFYDVSVWSYSTSYFVNYSRFVVFLNERLERGKNVMEKLSKRISQISSICNSLGKKLFMSKSSRVWKFYFLGRPVGRSVCSKNFTVWLLSLMVVINFEPQYERFEIKLPSKINCYSQWGNWYTCGNLTHNYDIVITALIAETWNSFKWISIPSECTLENNCTGSPGCLIQVYMINRVASDLMKESLIKYVSVKRHMFFFISETG